MMGAVASDNASMGLGWVLALTRPGASGAGMSTFTWNGQDTITSLYSQTNRVVDATNTITTNGRKLTVNPNEIV